VHQGTEQLADELMPKLWPGVPAIADPQRELYAAFGLQRTTAMQLFGPRAIGHGLRAIFKGHGIGSPRGADVMQMPGAFLVHDRQLVWQHPFRGGAGDLPDWLEVKRRAAVAVRA